MHIISSRAEVSIRVLFFRLTHTENGHLCPFLCPFFEVPPRTNMHKHNIVGGMESVSDSQLIDKVLTPTDGATRTINKAISS